MKLLKSILFAAAVSQRAGPGEGELCGACPDKGCDRDIWLTCKNDMCVCINNWVPEMGDDGKPTPGCMKLDSSPDNAHTCSSDPTGPVDPVDPVDPKPTVPPSATLCGKCLDSKGCGEKDIDHMYCHNKMNVCACANGWRPSDDRANCATKAQNADYLFLPEEHCADINPDVINELCPPEKCDADKNERCKTIEINGEFHHKCVCMDGFIYDG